MDVKTCIRSSIPLYIQQTILINLLGLLYLFRLQTHLETQLQTQVKALRHKKSALQL